MTIASAPGKVILFGEHAVVSGVAALGAAIDLRVVAKVEDAPGKLEIEVPNLNLNVKGFALDALKKEILSTKICEDAFQATKYVSTVLQKFDVRNVKVVVESEIPPSSGLGSSASVVVATLASINFHLGLGLSIDELAKEAYKIEKEVQQGLGSPTDTALATYGGYQMVREKAESIELPELKLIVGYTGVPHNTRLEVEKVQNFRESCPQIVDPIFQAMGEISRSSLNCIREQKLNKLGELMNANHGLLEALGVGTKELSELVYASRGAGNARGAKLTGAGGGGCMVAIPSPEYDGVIKAMTSIVQAGGKAFLVTTGCEGVKIEH